MVVVNLDEVRVRVTGDTKDFNRKIKQAEKQTKRSSKAMSRSINKFSASLKKMAKSFNPLKLGIGLLLGGGGLGLLVTRSLDAADKLAKVADTIGLSTDALQELRFAAELSGVSADSMSSALQAFGKRVGEARVETGTLVEILKKLDKQLLEDVQAARSMDVAFDLIIKKAASMTDQLDRAALFSAAFGRQAGVAMTNLIRDGADSLDEMRQRAHELGLVLSEDLLRGAEVAKDRMFELKQVVGTSMTRAVLENADAIESLAISLTDLIPAAIGAGKSMLEFLGIMERTPERQLEAALNRIKEINAEMNALDADRSQRDGLIGRFFGSMTDEAMATKQRAMDRLLVTVKELRAEIERRNPKEEEGPLIIDIGPDPAAIELLRALAAEREKMDTDLFRVRARNRHQAATVQDKINVKEEQALTRIIERNRAHNIVLREKAELLEERLSPAADVFTDKLTRGLEQMRAGTFSLKDALADLVLQLLQVALIAPAINSLGNSFASAGGSFISNLLTTRAHGGPVHGNVPVLVGERGPELIVPSGHGSVVPNNRVGSGGVSNHFVVDMRGASIAAVRRLERIVSAVNGSIEPRAVAAVANAQARTP